MQLIKQGDTSQPIVFLLVMSSDHISPLTGASPAVQVSKNGGVFAAAGGTTAEIGRGKYKYTPSAAEVNTLGVLWLDVTATGADPRDEKCQVVPDLPGGSVNVAQIGGVAVQLDAQNLLKVDVEDWKGAAAPANTGDAFARLGSPAGVSISADISTLKGDLDSGVSLTAAERTATADALLKRDMSAVTGEAARSPLNALRSLRNKVSISGGTVTVTKEDDATPAWTGAVTTDATAQPITGVDPA
jgi:hypothetical protein